MIVTMIGCIIGCIIEWGVGGLIRQNLTQSAREQSDGGQVVSAVWGCDLVWVGGEDAHLLGFWLRRR